MLMALTNDASRLWTCWDTWMYDWGNIKAVVKCRGCLISSWILLRHCWAINNGLIPAYQESVCILMGQVACSNLFWLQEQGHLASLGVLSLLSGSLLDLIRLACHGKMMILSLVHSPGNLIISIHWLPGENCCCFKVWLVTSLLCGGILRGIMRYMVW